MLSTAYIVGVSIESGSSDWYEVEKEVRSVGVAVACPGAIVA